MATMPSTIVGLSGKDPPEAFVWLQTGFIGDVVLLSGAIDLAIKHFPKASHHLVTTKAGLQIFEGHPGLNKPIVFEKRSSSAMQAFERVKTELYGQLSAHKIDPRRAFVMQVHGSFRSSWLAIYLGIPRITFNETQFTFGAKAKVDRLAVFHESQRQAMLLTALGLSRQEIVGAQTHLARSGEHTPDEWQSWVRAKDGHIVAVVPGSVWRTKRWPRGGFVKVIEWILASTSSRVVLLGSSEEKDLCDSIASKISGDDIANIRSRVLVLAGKTSLKQLREIYPALHAVVANDSSSVHFASGFHIPTVTIFGSTIPAMGFGPTSPRSRIVDIPLNCRPCSDHGPQKCPLGHFKCMRELSPSLVVEALKAVLPQ